MHAATHATPGTPPRQTQPPGTARFAPLAPALQAAPQLLMTHLLQAGLPPCGRDLLRVAGTRPVLARAARLTANERERMHMAAIRATCST